MIPFWPLKREVANVILARDEHANSNVVSNFLSDNWVAFPLALRVGTDIIACSRILDPSKPNLNRLKRLSARFLQDQEIRDLNARFPQWQSVEQQSNLERQRIASWLAGRWAAKEAAKKAWNASILSFRDLKVESDEEGQTQIICSPPFSTDGKVKEQAAQLSISHDQMFAVATVLATPLHADLLAELRKRKAEAEANIKG